ncbi:MAG: ExeA family protein [Nitrospiria bacterium]
MNYLEYYKLKNQPFNIAVDSRFYFSTNEHSQALVKLKYAASERKGLAVLVGEIGTGKTTLAHRLLEELDEKEFESALLVVIHSAISSEWLLRKIAIQLGVNDPLEGKTDLLSQLYNRLVEIYDSGKKAVVLIDEAQMLQSRELMEEFRGILNIELDNQKLITFVFFGLVELTSNLALDKPLQQRIAVRYELKSFPKKVTEEYVRYRLNVAGVNDGLFTKGALSAVHEYSKGFPRLINIICDNALFEGFLRRNSVIDQKIIEEVSSDLDLVHPV